MVLDAVKIEANGQVIADFGNSEDGELLLHISDKDTDKWQFAHGNSYDTGSDALLNRYKYNFGLTTDSRKTMGVAAAQELSNFKVNKAKAKDKTVKLVDVKKWLKKQAVSQVHTRKSEKIEYPYKKIVYFLLKISKQT